MEDMVTTEHLSGAGINRVFHAKNKRGGWAVISPYPVQQLTNTTDI